MNAYTEAFVQGFTGGLRLAIDLIRAPFVAWRVVTKNFFTRSHVDVEASVRHALRR